MEARRDIPKDKEPTENSVENTSAYVAGLRRSSRNRESYDELAQLEAELRRAYVAKELEVQILERETERYVESIRRREATELARLAQQVALEDDAQRRAEELKRAEDYRKHLDEQMVRKEETRCITQEEARREREILEEVERTRENYERSKVLEKKHELAERMRRECLILQEMREIRRQKEAETEARQLQRDLNYSKEIEERAKEIKEFREKQRKRHEEIVNAIASTITNVQTEKLERETLMVELIAEDMKRLLFIREIEEARRRKEMKEELATSLQEQMLLTERCKLRFAEQDREFAEEIMRKIMKDEKTMRLTTEARRRAQLQYREDLCRLIEERRRIREEEIARMEQAIKEERRRAMIKMERVGVERKQLLEEHASNVARFINKNALTPDERAIIDKSLKDKVTHDDTNSSVTNKSEKSGEQ